MIEALARVFHGCLTTLNMMSPYLLLGFFLSGVLSVLLPVAWVKKHLSASSRASVFKSSLLGVPLPLCSCGVLPVATWIRRNGASKGATGAFLLATPQTGVDGFLVALALLGLGMAAFIPFAALLSGVLLGLVLNNFPDPNAPQDHEEVQLNTDPLVKRVVRHGFVTIAGDIAIPLLVGVLIAGTLSAFVGESAFEAVGDGFLAKLLVVLAATPMYICATASIPIGASMLAAGLSPGTVFVFLMAGPATNAATFTTIGALLGKREAIVYLGGALLCALALETALDVLALRLPETAWDPHCHDESEPWRYAASLVLVAVLVWGKFQRSRS